MPHRVVVLDPKRRPERLAEAPSSAKKEHCSVVYPLIKLRVMSPPPPPGLQDLDLLLRQNGGNAPLTMTSFEKLVRAVSSCVCPLCLGG